MLLDLIVIQFPRPAPWIRPIQSLRSRSASSASSSRSCRLRLRRSTYKLFEDTSFIETPLPLLVALLALVRHCICLLMGLLAELLTRTYYEAQGKQPYVIASKRNL